MRSLMVFHGDEFCFFVLLSLMKDYRYVVGHCVSDLDLVCGPIQGLLEKKMIDDRRCAT